MLMQYCSQYIIHRRNDRYSARQHECKAAVLAVVTEASMMIKKKRKHFKRHPRQGDMTAKGDARFWIPIPDTTWDELTRPQAHIPGTWDAERFRSIYGVPKSIFDELVAEARQHASLAGVKRYAGDGKRCKHSKPLELKVAAVLEMNQAGMLFKSASTSACDIPG